jgi:hypothetical protein
MVTSNLANQFPALTAGLGSLGGNNFITSPFVVLVTSTFSLSGSFFLAASTTS